MSPHDLLIKHGRYRDPKLVADRFCISCKDIDDEVHFDMTCTVQNRLTRARELMLQIFSDDCSGISNMNLFTSCHPIMKYYAK